MEINVLEWWKVNFGRYPILANIARNVFAIPITTVAFESAFSTSERILDLYRSSLTPTTTEAFICTQDCLNEDFEALERFEQGHLDYSARVMLVVTWDRSFGETPNTNEVKDDFDSEKHETLATALLPLGLQPNTIFL